MSSGCGDVLSLADLQTAKKHQIFEAEVITGKSGGVSGGADIDYATNQVTGQVQKTLPAVLRDSGFSPVSWDFATGGTLTVNDRNKVVYDSVSKTWYSYAGTLPVVVPAGFNPVGNADWKPKTDPNLRDDLSSAEDNKGDALVTVKQPFAGAVPRSMHSKNSDTVSVRDFGAIGDGASDDSAAFQAASVFGGVVLVPPGVYKVDANVTGYNVHFIFMGSTLTGSGSLQGNISYFTNAGLKIGRDYHWRTQSGINSSLVIGEHLAMQQDDPGHLATLRIYPEGGLASPTQIAIEPFFVNDVDELHQVGNGEDITSILCGKSTEPDGSEERGGWVFKEYADGSRYRHHRIASFATVNGTPRDIHVVLGEKRVAMFDYVNGRTLFDNSNVSGVLSRGNTVIDVKNGDNTKVMRFFAQADEGEKGIAHLTAGVQDMKLVFETNAMKLQGIFTPTADNQGTVGSASLRFNAFYATNGTIQTSDERLKIFDELSEAELKCGLTLASDVKKFRWKDKSDDLYHFGVLAQRVISAFRDNGLDALEYGVVTYDQEADIYSVSYAELNSLCLAALAYKLLG